MALDDAAAAARERTAGRQAEMMKQMEKMVKERKERFQELDKSGGERKRRENQNGRKRERERERCCCRCCSALAGGVSVGLVM